MADHPWAKPVPEEDENDGDPGEVATTFATVGRGWSGREKDDDEDDDET